MSLVTVEALVQYAQEQDRIAALGVLHTLCQQSVNTRSLDELAGLLRAPLEQWCPGQEIEALDRCLAGLPEYEAALAVAYAEAMARAAGRSDIKGVYCEYFFDGSEGCAADLFLCRAFSREDDDWAANFAHEDVIGGPDVDGLLGFDPDLVWALAPAFVADAYAHVLLLRGFVRAVAVGPSSLLPVGFAQHDRQIVYL
ncbi:MAG: hypothetical protein ABN482_14190 [Corticimicrobacter sp.]|uniref:hypothetical protein n=1 Tax=Corticimicrobacter sp. TaxID=2678536 RepID=UPI0032D9EB7D